MEFWPLRDDMKKFNLSQDREADNIYTDSIRKITGLAQFSPIYFGRRLRVSSRSRERGQGWSNRAGSYEVPPKPISAEQVQVPQEAKKGQKSGCVPIFHHPILKTCGWLWGNPVEEQWKASRKSLSYC